VIGSRGKSVHAGLAGEPGFAVDLRRAGAARPPCGSSARPGPVQVRWMQCNASDHHSGSLDRVLFGSSSFLIAPKTSKIASAILPPCWFGLTCMRARLCYCRRLEAHATHLEGVDRGLLKLAVSITGDHVVLLAPFVRQIGISMRLCAPRLSAGRRSGYRLETVSMDFRSRGCHRG
jgi:hypothetical protein